MSTFDTELPQPESKDNLIAIARAIVTGIPYVGGSITEVWSGFFASPLAKRREEWLHQLAVAVVELQNRDPQLTVGALQQDERFVSAVLNATAIAIRTHRREKLDALRNAVISSVVHTDIDEDLQAMFMKYVDEFTPWHLRVAAAFQDPEAHFRKIGNDVEWFHVDDSGTRWTKDRRAGEFIRQAFPELMVSDHQFLDQIVEDLGTRNLIPVKWMFQENLPEILPYMKVTGQKFMKFIGQERACL